MDSQWVRLNKSAASLLFFKFCFLMINFSLRDRQESESIVENKFGK